MKKLFKKDKMKAVLFALSIVVFQLCACALVSVLTVKSAIAVTLALICIMCVLNLRKLLYIKLK